MNDDDVRRILRELEAPDHVLEAPPAQVWDRIAAEVGIDAAPPAPPVVDLGDEASAPVIPAAPGAGQPRRWGSWLGVAAGFVLVAAIAATALLGQLRDTTLAEVELAALDDRASDTPAQVVTVGDGRELQVQAELPDFDGHYEVWLLDEEVQTLVSLGPLRADGRYPIPAEVSLSDLPVVDISAEPDDDDPAHSGDSLLRGVLDLDA